ncbi:protein ALP1-like [Centruroides sculpturatus]|uniref:protein ALP1-like n=1 Tax=Centruroides sculpturatus TaxID=218467 RepID=UPI000C6CB65E|nr:protein ALP1-like [Centruroides sculpturatus]
MECLDTNYRKCISLDKRIAIALYTLSSTVEFRSIANLFGVDKTSVFKTLHEFCNLLIEKVDSKIMFPGTTKELLKKAEEFENLWQFLQCIGAIDGTHIKVSPPKEHAVDYYNYKSFYSVVLLAICDAKYKFTYVNVGAPGRNNDSVFQNSGIYQIFNVFTLYSELRKSYNGVNVPLLLLGDSAFPLMPILMKPFPDSANLPNEKKQFNYHLSRARRVVENAFGRLKARFRFISRRLELNLNNVSFLIRACCILHNICEELNDNIHDDWLNELQHETTVNSAPTVVGEYDHSAQEIRNALVMYFNN